MNMLKIIGAVFLIALLSVAVYFTFSGKEKPKDQDVAQITSGPKPQRGNVKPQRVKRTREKKLDGEERGIRQNPEKGKPTFVLDDDDEAKLTEEQRRTIDAIRAALEDNSRKTVLKLVQKLQASDEWPDGIPKSIKLAAIDALGWFGASCLPELAGFLADGDEEVIQAAIEKYEEMLSDVDLSPLERSEILVQASKVINDPDAIDSMLFELNNMPRSVAVPTIQKMMAEGNAATQQVLPDNIEYYTGEENLDTPEKLDEWLKQNPDDEGDDEFYGVSKGKTSQGQSTSK